MPATMLQVKVIQSMQEVNQADWDALVHRLHLGIDLIAECLKRLFQLFQRLARRQRVVTVEENAVRDKDRFFPIFPENFDLRFALCRGRGFFIDDAQGQAAAFTVDNHSSNLHSELK